MHERFLLKELGRLGGGKGELRELRVLNRVIRWTAAGLKYEADPRHAEIVVRGVAGAERALSAPGTGSKDYEAPGEEEDLPDELAMSSRIFLGRSLREPTTLPSTGPTYRRQPRSCAGECRRRGWPILGLCRV